MKNFKKGGGFKKSFGDRPRFGGRPGFGGGNRFGGGRSGGGRDFKEMHQATCGDCGKDCEVPFRPTGERPVYCRDCFAKNAPSGPREGGFQKPSRSFERRDEGSRPSFRQAPSGSERGGAEYGELLKHIELLGTKIDRLAQALDIQRALAQSGTEAGAQETEAAGDKPKTARKTKKAAPKKK